jgi:predicted acylesterase/phospholipase RssA
MSSPSVQLAFQGGGAKFVSMLPVADALQDCERRGKVHIKAVAGTSAGAICASLIAADCDFTGLRRYLVASGPKHIQNLMGDNYRRLKNLLDAPWYGKLPAFFDCVSVLKAVFYNGEPVLHEKEFGFFLMRLPWIASEEYRANRFGCFRDLPGWKAAWPHTPSWREPRK